MKKLIKLAKTLSKTSHKGQRYGQLNDYFKYHVKGVVRSLKLYKFSEEYLIVAYLHDVVEDTNINLATIENLFGSKIANAVDAITKRTDEPREDYIKRCRRNHIARIVKLHDAMFNANNCAKNKNKHKFNEYISQTISQLTM